VTLFVIPRPRHQFAFARCICCTLRFACVLRCTHALPHYHLLYTGYASPSRFVTGCTVPPLRTQFVLRCGSRLCVYATHCAFAPLRFHLGYVPLRYWCSSFWVRSAYPHTLPLHVLFPLDVTLRLTFLYFVHVTGFLLLRFALSVQFYSIPTRRSTVVHVTITISYVVGERLVVLLQLLFCCYLHVVRCWCYLFYVHIHFAPHTYHFHTTTFHHIHLTHLHICSPRFPFTFTFVTFTHTLIVHYITFVPCTPHTFTAVRYVCTFVTFGYNDARLRYVVTLYLHSLLYVRFILTVYCCSSPPCIPSCDRYG